MRGEHISTSAHPLTPHNAWDTCAHLHISMYATQSCTPHICIAWHTCTLRGIRVHIRIVCVPSAHLHICTSVHLHCVCALSTSAHLYIRIVCVPSAHVHICIVCVASVYQHIYTSVHLHCVCAISTSILCSVHLHCVCAISKSTHLHICTSTLCVCHQHIYTPIHLYIYIVCVPSAHLYGVAYIYTSTHPH